MKKSTRELRKLFSEGHDGWGKFIYGYSYVKWVNLTFYILRKGFQSIFPDPEVKLRCPEEISNREITELIEFVAANITPDTQHGKIVKLGDAKKIITLQRSIDLPDLEKIIPYKTARDLIINNPDHIAVFDCPCRSTKENPCEPLDVCIAIGEPFSGFALEHQINNAHKISQDEAVEIIRAEDARGHIHTVWFKDTLGGRMYCMCNCCRCCCTAMRAHFFGIPLLASSGYVSQVNDRCDGCSECIKFCQFKALMMDGEKAEVTQEKCMGCGVCESKCPQHAITLKKDPIKGEPLDLSALLPEEELTNFFKN
jgi:Pyruvate/2-oxoacid:ferredoxin oxidoreductase delta subunit